uniref:Glycoside hydrolase family 3 N-terminal domain-containing protein n=1 Tax=Ciona savignyi TaxID=51511 RepID=H2YA95_CIOSA
MEKKVVFRKENLNLGNFPFRNISLTREERVVDLVNRLTLDEVILQLTRGGVRDNGPAPAIDRLGINRYNWNTECLRGYAMNGDATCFPQPIGLAATFDQPLIKKMAHVIAVEARAKHNNFTKHGNFGDHTGLSCFSPVINIMRHPLWGRNQETYGEDPVLTSLFARAYVTGLQGDEIYLPATAVCKHFVAYAGPENIPTSRFGFSANVSDHDIGATFYKAFRECVHSGALGVMCSYNAINGIPSCANPMLENTLRRKFNFNGYIVSDENALENIDIFFNYTKSKMETAAVALNAG